MLQPIVQFLNRPNVKEGVKNIAGSFTFCFGLAQIYNRYQSWRHPAAKENDARINKILLAFGNVSLILSAAISRPGIKILSHYNLIGPSPIFATHPWHPRHVASIAAVVLGLPLLGCPADPKLQAMIFFNLLTSRPVLHLGNQWTSFKTAFAC